MTDPEEAASFIRKNRQAEIFVQRFVNPPHLIHGHKWDIGVYVLVTNLRPLRVYYYGDLLLRFCKEAWKGLNPADVDTYVVADDYLSPWDFKA